MKKYRLYCETDEKYKFVISDSEPIQCPHDVAHTIRLESICIVDDDVQVNDGTPVDTLANYKLLKNKEIDKKTRELIAQGFVYNSIVFSTSETAQRNWMGIDQFSADLTYPFGVSTKDDGEYLLADAAEIHTFVLTAMGTLEYHYSTGRTLKQQINSATTEAEVDAVVDNR